MKIKFESTWDRVVFFGSIAGLLLLIGISLFRYYYLVPVQEELSSNTRYIKQLENENRLLQKENRKLSKELENEKF